MLSLLRLSLDEPLELTPLPSLLSKTVRLRPCEVLGGKPKLGFCVVVMEFTRLRGKSCPSKLKSDLDPVSKDTSSNSLDNLRLLLKPCTLSVKKTFI